MALAESWHIRSRSRDCAATGVAFVDGQPIVTALFPDPESSGYLRKDFTVETWADTPVTAQLDFALRALAPRTVIIRHDGRELWRGPVGEKTTRHAVSLRLAPGRTVLEFSTDTPATREGPAADARALAFALYDPRLSVPTP